MASHAQVVYQRTMQMWPRGAMDNASVYGTEDCSASTKAHDTFERQSVVGPLTEPVVGLARRVVKRVVPDSMAPEAKVRPVVVIRSSEDVPRNPRWLDTLKENIRANLKTENGTMWTSEELATLSGLIAKFGCEPDLFLKYLPERSLEDIQSKIVECHNLMLKSDEDFRKKTFSDDGQLDAKDPSAEELKKNWFACIKALQSSRAVQEVNDVSDDVFQEVLSGFATTSEPKAKRPRRSCAKRRKAAKTPMNYTRIYQELGNIATLTDQRRLKPLPPPEAAVLLSIIDEIEREVDLTSDLKYRMPAYATILHDLQQGYFDEFSFCRRFQQTNVGEAHLNILGLSDEQRLHDGTVGPTMLELVVVAISLSTIFTVVAPASVFCAARRKKPTEGQQPVQPLLPRYKPGHIPNFADGLDLMEDDTLYEFKTEMAFPDKIDAASSKSKVRTESPGT
uniref:NET domain-containing protein n=1 Tax=Steinernema glaseri TaxID=37863 RepID=A0A1I8AK99_9BILA